MGKCHADLPKAFFPQTNVTIDEELFQCHSRYPFMEYMPHFG